LSFFFNFTIFINTIPHRFDFLPFVPLFFFLFLFCHPGCSKLAAFFFFAIPDVIVSLIRIHAFLFCIHYLSILPLILYLYLSFSLCDYFFTFPFVSFEMKNCFGFLL